MEGAEVCVFKQADNVCLGRLLKSRRRGQLEAQARVEFVCDLTHHALKGETTDQEVGGFLVLAYLSQSHGAGTISVRLLNTHCKGELVLADRFRCQHLACLVGCLCAQWDLFCSCHDLFFSLVVLQMLGLVGEKKKKAALYLEKKKKLDAI